MIMLLTAKSTYASLALLTFTCGALGCASAPPPRELQDARAAYRAAAESPAAVKAQRDIGEAKEALGRAEAAFDDDPKGAGTRDWSYIAQRKAHSARARASALTALDDGRAAKGELVALRAQEKALRDHELDGARSALAGERGRAESERQARADADAKTRDALATIAGMTATQSDRGLVLTLSGSVLFASGKSTLLPAAQARLAEASTALKADGRSIHVVGHTDSTGSDQTNLTLSRQRAEAVRAYLVSKGMTSGRIDAEGAGKDHPIADNATPEGRANNRRVELILVNAKP